MEQKEGRPTDDSRFSIKRWSRNSVERKNVNESKSTGKMIFWNVVRVSKKGQRLLSLQTEPERVESTAEDDSVK